jgi:DNA repair protein RecN (Recombination protein N)
MCDDFRNRKRDGDYLAFRCDELNKFDPSIEDYERTKALCDKAGKFFNMASSLQRAQACLDEGAGGEALGKPLRELTKILAGLSAVSPEMQELSGDAADIAQRVEDLSFRLGRFSGSVDIDESELEEAQERLAGYQAMLRKMAVHEVGELLAEWERLSGELRFIENAASEALVILKRLRSSVTQLEAGAQSLSKARHKAGKEISKAVESELKHLAMPGASLEVRFESVQKSEADLDVGIIGEQLVPVWKECASILSKMTDGGSERAQLYLASNPGEPALPLQKIASGGEVSRIMLAFKKALAAGADTCILVFDEIDTGISGRVADVVGQKLKELARQVQIICISHLPQVAAYGETHFRVHKFGKDSRTESTISRLSSKESAEEIARLLSGNEVNSASLANAKNLIMKARQPSAQ